MKKNNMLDKEFWDEVFRILKQTAPRKELCCDPNLTPVKNGIVDRAAKKLMPFSPDYVFVYKEPVEYITLSGRPYMAYEDGTMQDLDEWLRDYKPADQLEVARALCHLQ